MFVESNEIRCWPERETKPRVPISLIFFNAGYVVVTSSVALATDNCELGVFILHIAVLIGSMVFVHLHYNLSQGLLWCFSIWGLLHMAGGLAPIPQVGSFSGQSGVLYSLALVRDGVRYDQLVHAFGFGSATWLCWELLCSGVRTYYGQRLIPTSGVIALCWVGGMGFGALNELVEFVAYLIRPETNVGDYHNTGWDLIYNALGASAVGVVIALRGRSSHETALPNLKPK